MSMPSMHRHNTSASLKARLDSLVQYSARDRERAMRELQDGKKRGHWVWWLFPTLAARAGDMNSARQARGAGADLASPAEARAYIQHPELRASLLTTLQTAHAAFARHEEQGPYHVLDEGFGRQVNGEWVGGPVDSFKVWCSATMFAAVAKEAHDSELRQAAVAVLGDFKGDIVYTPGGEGTAGHVASDAEQRAVTLGPGPDLLTIQMLGGSSADDV